MRIFSPVSFVVFNLLVFEVLKITISSQELMFWNYCNCNWVWILYYFHFKNWI